MLNSSYRSSSRLPFAAFLPVLAVTNFGYTGGANASNKMPTTIKHEVTPVRLLFEYGNIQRSSNIQRQGSRTSRRSIEQDARLKVTAPTDAGTRYIQYDPEAQRREEEAKERRRRFRERLEKARERAREAEKREAEANQRAEEARKELEWQQQQEEEARKAEQARAAARAKALNQSDRIREIRQRARLSPPPGNYLCLTEFNDPETVWLRHEPRGFFTLKSDGTYCWLNRGPTFPYRYDAGLREIKFLDGPLAQPGLTAKYVYNQLDNYPLLRLTFQTPATRAGEALPIVWECIWKQR